METQSSNIYGVQKISSKRDVCVYCDTDLLKETKKSQINSLTYHLKEIEKEIKYVVTTEARGVGGRGKWMKSVKSTTSKKKVQLLVIK